MKLQSNYNSLVDPSEPKKSPRDIPQPTPTTSAKSKHSAPSKPTQPLQTSRLRPYRQRHNRSVMSILDDGTVCIELLKEEKVKEVITNQGAELS